MERPPICEAIRQARQSVGMSQPQLAELMGIAQTNIARWETEREPRLDAISEIEDALELPRGYILTLAGYVAEPAITVEEAIAHDKGLTKTAKQLVLGAYHSVRRH